jgi:hypothetical protein
MSRSPRTTSEIISDEEIIRVHANANFGDTPPREAVNEGVRKYAVGFACGSTMRAILIEHGLIGKPVGSLNTANLTRKGKEYARSIYRTVLDEASARAQVHEIGNQIHNIGCECHGDEELRERLADLASRAWRAAQGLSAEPVALPVNTGSKDGAA